MSESLTEYCTNCQFNHIFPDSLEKLQNAPCVCDCHNESESVELVREIRGHYEY